MTDSMTPAQRSQCMSRIRSTDTKPELALRKRLFAKGMRFRTRLKLAGKPDIAFTRARLVVFIDGCFWHGCPLHGTSPKSNSDYWNAKLQRNSERDSAIDAVLTADGWQLTRCHGEDSAHEERSVDRYAVRADPALCMPDASAGVAAAALE
jgi:DNA mismatch endonuclease, patch repair protein